MLTPTYAPWRVRGATFALWALAAASAVFWGLKLTGGPSPVNVPVAPLRPVAAVDPAAIARLLGSAPAAATLAVPTPVASLASRLQLVGVVAGERSGGGAAVISVDGKPASPYRVGSAIEEGLVLQSVHGRQAVLANGATQVTLELPPLRAPAGAQAPMAAPR